MNVEADIYSTEMWKRCLGRVCSLVIETEAKRRAFAAGFNGELLAKTHHTARDAWADGRHSAILLGYISAEVS